MKKIINNIILLTLIFISAFNAYTQSVGDPAYDDNIDSYRLIAVSNDSIESISNTISVEKPYALYAPNAFSPDGDGINDSWVIVNAEFFPNCEVWIYTRMGQLIYNSKRYNNDWSGLYNGQPLPESSYVYLIDNNVKLDSTINIKRAIKIHKFKSFRNKKELRSEKISKISFNQLTLNKSGRKN